MPDCVFSFVLSLYCPVPSHVSETEDISLSNNYIIDKKFYNTLRLCNLFLFAIMREVFPITLHIYFQTACLVIGVAIVQETTYLTVYMPAMICNQQCPITVDP